MKRASFLAVVIPLPFGASGQVPFKAFIDRAPAPADHQLSWPTAVGCNCQVEVSPDLATWVDSGIVEAGTGSYITYALVSNTDRLFYRVRETPHLFGGTGDFLIGPEEGAEIHQIDGVCFAFDLNLSEFVSLPSKIRIYKRLYNTGESWELIGSITAFNERRGVKFVRGSAVWLPQSAGDYEVLAAVVDDSGGVIAAGVRQITVIEMSEPWIEITNGPPAQSSDPVSLDGCFELNHADTVRRVEFYDNGVLAGTAAREPFEDTVRDLQGNSVELLAGEHAIVVRAYDYTGVFGDSTPAYEIEVTGGNARPELKVTAPAVGVVLVQGGEFAIGFDPPTDPDGESDLTRVVASRFIIPFADYNYVHYPEEVISADSEAPFDGPLTVSTTGWDPGTYMIKVVAQDSSNATSYHHYFRVRVNSSETATFAADLAAEIADEQSANPSNPAFVGIESSSGVFDDGLNHQLEIDSGVLLTTGRFSIWNAGDLWESSSEFDQLSACGSFDLENLVAGAQTQDAAALEFDVTCSNRQLEFEYQFGSEEYDQFVGEFNDAFLVLLDGTVVNRLPDCVGIVGVNTVNIGYPQLTPPIPAKNRHLFLGDDEDIDPDDMLPNGDEGQVEYDGVTVRLRARVFVVGQSTHRVRLVIADVNDGIVDSGVFVETGSLRTITPTP